MLSLKDFSEYYKTISDTELINILDNPNNYQPIAIEAAREEYEKRALSESDIQEARQPLIAEQEEKDRKSEKLKAVETKLKATAHTLIDTINPVQSEKPSTDKTIRFIVIIFGGLFLYQLIADFGTHLAYIKDFPEFPFASSMYLLPQIFLPIATITFWKRKTVGWILLTIFITSTAVGEMSLLFQAFTWKHTGLGSLDIIFPRPSPTTIIVQLLFSGGTLYVLCKTYIREVFSIDNQRMISTIAITTLVICCFIYIISSY